MLAYIVRKIWQFLCFAFYIFAEAIAVIAILSAFNALLS